MPLRPHSVPFRPAIQAIQRVVSAAHHSLLDRGLPRKAAVYLHQLHPENFAAFQRLVDFFREAGYRIASNPEDFRANPTERTVWLSFDDNSQGWYGALDLFDRLSVKATFYVTSGVFRDQAAPDTLYRFADALGDDAPAVTLSTEELRALHQRGHVIGAHTHTHPVLTDLTLEEAVAEIRLSKDVLEGLIEAPVEHFAFPYGMRRYFNDDLLAICLGLGFRTVARAASGLQHSDPDPAILERSQWNLDRPLRENLRDLRVDGRFFEALTGRSAV